MSEGTLRKWVTNANRKERAATPEAALPIDVTAAAWSVAQRLLALQETHPPSATTPSPLQPQNCSTGSSCTNLVRCFAYPQPLKKHLIAD